MRPCRAPPSAHLVVEVVSPRELMPQREPVSKQASCNAAGGWDEREVQEDAGAAVSTRRSPVIICACNAALA